VLSNVLELWSRVLRGRLGCPPRDHAFNCMQTIEGAGSSMALNYTVPKSGWEGLPAVFEVEYSASDGSQLEYVRAANYNPSPGASSCDPAPHNYAEEWATEYDIVVESLQTRRLCLCGSA
jgi:hypothetical protein